MDVETQAPPKHGLATAGPAAPSVRSARTVLLVVAVAILLQGAAWLFIYQVPVAHGWGYTLWPLDDRWYYAGVGDLARTGQWAYSDFPFEYPPLALVLFQTPPLNGTLDDYERWFSIQMIVIGALSATVTAALATRVWTGVRRPLAAVTALAVATVAAGAIGAGRFDGAVALLIIVAVMCVVCRRWVLAGLALGLGFSLKLMPIVLLPLVLVLAARRRPVVWALAATVAAAVLPFLPFVLHDAAGVRSSLFGAQVSRGLQVESIAATPYLVAAIFRHGDLSLVVPYGGSVLVVAPSAAFVAGLAPFVVCGLLAVVYAGVWRSRRSLRADLSWAPPASLAVVLAALCGNKVLSPQHLLWTLPLVALCLVDERTLPRLAGALMVVALVLTQIEYPALYSRLPEHAIAPLVTISARNVVLAAAFALATAAVWTARTPEPAPALAGQQAQAVRGEGATTSVSGGLQPR